jgi:tripartite-type tricarboxylate transporter receptor subunit TctC
VAGIKLNHIPYKGTAPAAQDLLAGVVPVAFESSLTASGQFVLSGKLKAIAITSAGRAAILPDVPTVAEQGYPGFDVPTAFGLVGPANLPPDVVKKLNDVVTQSMNNKSVSDRLAKIGAEPRTMTPSAFGTYISTESARWGNLIRTANIKLD